MRMRCFVVSPDSESIVLNLKMNLKEWVGFAATLISFSIVFWAIVMRQRAVPRVFLLSSLLRETPILAIFAATADSEDTYSTDGKSYALRDVGLRAEGCSTLVTAALRAIAKLDLNQIKRLPDNWASLLCSPCALEGWGFRRCHR